jgi:hypothetical protein
VLALHFLLFAPVRRLMTGATRPRFERLADAN